MAASVAEMVVVVVVTRLSMAEMAPQMMPNPTAANPAAAPTWTYLSLKLN